MTNDIVAKLEAWLADNVTAIIDCTVVERACNEIVALREMRDAHVRILSARLDEDEENMRRWIAKARVEALEEAAHECDEEAKISSEGFRDGCEICAAAIRALKDRRHD